jgi:N-acetyl-gamma-glutamyl-phosphate reductase
MSVKTVFIDGSAGTTGLRIRERLAARTDLNVVVLPEETRKDMSARRAALNDADVAFLCLPDAAAIEAVSLVTNPRTVVIDTSTAHRTAEGWAYGFPELDGRREEIARATRIANPGCHASGFIALVEPLVREGLLTRDVALSAFSLTGYSGGGKKMIADYGTAATPLHQGGRFYALGQTHKHLPEIVRICSLSVAPIFCPVIVPHLSGMETVVSVFGKDLAGGLDDIRRVYADRYGAGGLVRYVDDPSEAGVLSSAALSGRDDMEVSVYGNAERLTLVARFDNLGKGASGAAIQNMNIALGCEETTGLVVPA